jgi:dTDP-4-dehydrorhamnose reductase
MLADYAAQLARRFPWLSWYTPVNEPLTTARFSGLYGHWHPHARSNHAFARMIVNQCRAIVLAMKAIREVNPEAKLVQTEDLGTIYSTERLRHQADFENDRRWLTWDLLCGEVDVTHPLHRHLLAWGIDVGELTWFREHRCKPSLIGIDHYVTSDRFLDHHLHRYPSHLHGGNGREAYADVDAVRVLERPGTSLRHIVLEAARRYHLPVVLTEIHLGCAEDEQVRWLHESIRTCEQLAASGVDVRAVTSWAMLGSYDWDTLLTRGGDTYESGAFCLRTGTPRPTAVARYIDDVIHGRDPDRAGILGDGGWWRRADRLEHGVGMPCSSSPVSGYRAARQEPRVALFES